MTASVPAFASKRALRARLDDAADWTPSIATILERHGLTGSRSRTTAGVGATYPTFLHGDLVIKLFGGHSSWRASFRAERAALAAVAGVPGVAAPELLAAGWLDEGADQSWPYLVMTRMKGVPWGEADLSAVQRLRVAADLGECLRRLWPLRSAEALSLPQSSTLPTPKEQPASRWAVSTCSMEALSLPQNGMPPTPKEQPASRWAVSTCSMEALSLPQNGTPPTPKEQPASRWAVSTCSMEVPALELMAVPSLAEAAKRSSLPAPLISGIGGFLSGLGPLADAFVHGDLMHRHVFVAEGRLAGIIDWGDAALADPHYELAKLHLDLFDGDKALLRTFLEAGQWEMKPDFAHRALAFALHRQAQGLIQHPTMDVFHKLPRLMPPGRVATLDQLANRLFAV